ncbi:hypothetical protein [Absicoccus porci]|nr:hypothetical protein [Absicoccus porci]
MSFGGDIPGCVIQELGYCIPYENKFAIDPLTVALSIRADEKKILESVWR